MTQSLREQLEEVAEAVQTIDPALLGPEISSIVEAIDITVKKDGGNALGRIEAKHLLDTFRILFSRFIRKTSFRH